MRARAKWPRLRRITESVFPSRTKSSNTGQNTRIPFHRNRRLHRFRALPALPSLYLSRNLNQHPVQQLVDRPVAFDKRVAMIHGAGKIRVRERDSSKRPIAEGLTRSRISVQAEEESRLGIDKRMAPAVEYDARNIPLGVEARGPEHLHHLLAY